jgi:glycosyltransferase involved in cell wall biosynthesis
MKRVLIITYYWPPSGGGGVMRWLKISKYLREFGWEPVIYTPDAGETPGNDPSLIDEIPEGIEILKQPIWEPYAIYKRFTGTRKNHQIYSAFINEEKEPSLAHKVSVWLRGNFFIPDARKFWINPSIRFLKEYLEEHPVMGIVSTGPPHSMHMIGLGLKAHFPHLPWVADFRDPWTNIDFYGQLMLTKWADGEHHRLEEKVLRTADKVVAVSWSWARDLEAIRARPVLVITNGFDADDFRNHSLDLDSQFSIIHTGSMNRDRNSYILWSALEWLCRKHEGFRSNLKIVLIGPTDYTVFESIEKRGLTTHLETINRLPHNEALQRVCRSQLLLLPINRTRNTQGRIPVKLYEYLASRRPVLCIGSLEGDAARIIRWTNAGKVLDFQDESGVRKALYDYYKDFCNGTLAGLTSGIERFSYNELAKQMAAALDRPI